MSRPASERFRDPIQAPGTDEALWRAWGGWNAFPVFRLPERGRVVVVAAHPDDEVLGFGGSLALLADAGVDLTVVSVTDGEGSHPGSTTVSPAALAEIRAQETRAALDALGAHHASVVRLGVPDTEVAGHEAAVVERLAPVLAGADLVAAPWTADVHSDHEAAGRAVVTAARRAGAACVLYPVWMWHWARPADPRVPWNHAARIPLAPSVTARKRAAVECFASQIAPLGPGEGDGAVILPEEELAHHLREVEVVFR